MEKSVETKLELPFNKCWDRINCFEICFENFVKNYALKHQISEDEAKVIEEVKNYDRETNCNDLCPLECESTHYKITGSMLSLTEYSEYSLPWIPVVEKKLNITVNSTEEFNKNFLEIFVYFDSLQYTKISQPPKTTLSALVSNFGGSTGLFLDLSFMKACRAIEFILGVIFKF